MIDDPRPPRARATSRPSPARGGASFLGALLWLALIPPLAAQPLFRLGGWTGSTEISFGVQEQEFDALSGRSSLFDRQLYEEKLTLRNTVTVVDRKFLTLNYGFTLGLLQSELDTDEQKGAGDGKLRAFDLTATFRPLSYRRLTLLLNSYDNETPVEFAGTRELRTESLGLTMQVGPGWFPGSVKLNELHLGSTSEFGETVRGIDQRRRSFTYSGANRWPRHQLNASFQLEDLDDLVAPRFSHRSQTANLSHRFEVLAPRLATVRSILRVFDRRGELDSSSFYLDEELRLRHRKNLSTSVRYVAQRLDSFSGPASDSQRLLLGLNHRLFDSVVTDLFVGENRSTSRGRGTDLTEAGLNSTYKKKLPKQGRLSARMTSRYELRDSLRGDAQELVTGERHVARFGVPARLERPAVILGSVVVTDELRATIFEEGVDYELLVIGDFAEITALPGGAIRDGQAILVEYRVEAPAATRSEALRLGFDLTLDYGWIAPFWGYRRTDFELVEGFFDRLLNDQQDRFVGVRFRRRGRRLELVSFNELRTRDSDLQSFESLRFGEGLTFSPRPAWTLRLNYARLETDFTIPVRESRVSEGRVGLRWASRPTLSFEVYANSRVTRDTAAADQVLERYGLQSRWVLGKITVLASAERWTRDREEDRVVLERLEGLTASLRISRRFSPGRVSASPKRRRPEPWPADLPGLWAEPAPPDEPDEQPSGG